MFERKMDVPSRSKLSRRDCFSASVYLDRGLAGGVDIITGLRDFVAILTMGVLRLAVWGVRWRVLSGEKVEI